VNDIFRNTDLNCESKKLKYGAAKKFIFAREKTQVLIKSDFWEMLNNGAFVS